MDSQTKKVDVLALTEVDGKYVDSKLDLAAMLGAREVSLDEYRNSGLRPKAHVYVVSGIGVQANRYFRAKGEIVYQPGQATHYLNRFHALAATVENEQVLEYDPVEGKLYFPVGQD